MDFIEIKTERGVCRLFSEGRPAVILIEPTEEREMESAAREADLIARGTDRPFALAAFPVRDWFAELSPWENPPVFGKQAFGGRADDTLAFLQKDLLPKARSLFPSAPPLILGGYSLAGLFSLWCGHETDLFEGIAAASPSVWFPGWMEYARAHPPQMKAVCLSLGDREEKTKNPVMAQVGACIRSLYALYQTQPLLSSCLQWNPGNHFADPAPRTAQAFLWAMEHIPIS